ncbi:MAG: universal stress protein [Planctomycetota bacterium]
MNLERILVGCCLSKDQEAVWQAALDLARVHGSRLLPLHVISGEGLLTSSGDAEAYAQGWLEQLAARAREAGVEVDTPRVLRGARPAGILLEQAKAWGASWVVIGAAERGGWERLLGTCAEALCRESAVPVLVVPERGPSWTRVLCAVDGSEPARAALTVAMDLARSYSAPLSLLYVEVDGEAQRQAADEVMRSLGLHEVEVDVLSRRGASVPEVIVAAQQETGADVLVLGTAGRTGLGRILRPNTAEALLRKLPCALLVAPATA